MQLCPQLVDARNRVYYPNIVQRVSNINVVHAYMRTPWRRIPRSSSPLRQAQYVCCCPPEHRVNRE